MQTITADTLTYHAGQWEASHSAIITEQPVTFTINNEIWLTFICTSKDLEALVEFLCNENSIQTLTDIASLRVYLKVDDTDIWINRKLKRTEQWISSSGCSGSEVSFKDYGYTSKMIKPINSSLLLPQTIKYLITQLMKSQDLFFKSGDMQPSVLWDGDEIIITAEEIGRHKTVDKKAGKLLLEQIEPEGRILLTTGRVSSEMIQKVGRMGGIDCDI
jgi:FdhD protein